MFQNISEEVEEEINIEEEKKSKIKNIIKKSITKQNIILAIISFMISMVGFSQNIYPFGLAMLAAACSRGIPIGILALITTIGTFCGFGLASGITYIMTVIIFITMVMIFKPKILGAEEENEKLRLSKYLFASCIIVQAVKLISSSMLVYNVLEAIMFSIVTVLFYKIFVNSIGVVTEYNQKKVFSVEELIGVSLLVAIAISAFGNLAILGLSIRNILCIIIVLVLGWKNGALVGGTAGITIGVVLGIIGLNEPLMIASFALSGMVAGILNRFGKIGVIIGFIIGNAILTYISNGNITAIIHLREIMIASIALLLIPKTIEINIDDIMGKKRYLPVAKERILEAHKDTIYKLNSVSETISEIAKTYDDKDNEPIETREEFEKENEEMFKSDLIINISNLTENALYEDIVNENNKILSDIYKTLSKKDEINQQDMLDIFERHNNYIIGLEENQELKNDMEALIKTINYTYKISKLNFLWKQKLNENRKNVSNELNGVSRVISTMADNMNEKTADKIKKQEEEIKNIIEQKNIKITDIAIKNNKNGKHIIKLFLPKQFEGNDKIIETILSKTYNQQIVIQKREEIDETTILKTYQTEDIYSVQVGIAKTTKNNSKVSGDSYIKTKLSDGKYLLAISDGMGSGENAKRSSNIAIKMLEKLLKDGFDKDASLSLINSTMVLNADEDMYSTLDVAILDLYEGTIECIKNGACPTYIKSNGNVEQIQSITLPAGILNEIDLIVYEKDLQNGDIIIMCSDGITDSKLDTTQKGAWLKQLLEKMKTDNVQKMADIILGEAIDNGMGIAKDDMTIIIAKINKK